MDIYARLDKLVIELNKINEHLSSDSSVSNSEFKTAWDEAVSAFNETAVKLREPDHEGLTVDIDSSQAKIMVEASPKTEITTPENTAASKLTIMEHIDGSSSINFPGGGTHHVVGGIGGPTKALLEAYGLRIGNIIDSGKLYSQEL